MIASKWFKYLHLTELMRLMITDTLRQKDVTRLADAETLSNLACNFRLSSLSSLPRVFHKTIHTLHFHLRHIFIMIQQEIVLAMVTSLKCSVDDGSFDLYLLRITLNQLLLQFPNLARLFIPAELITSYAGDVLPQIEEYHTGGDKITCVDICNIVKQLPKLHLLCIHTHIYADLNKKDVDHRHSVVHRAKLMESLSGNKSMLLSLHILQNSRRHIADVNQCPCISTHFLASSPLPAATCLNREFVIFRIVSLLFFVVRTRATCLHLIHLRAHAGSSSIRAFVTILG